MESPQESIYCFENVEVNLRHNTLRHGEHERHLRRKTFQVLIYLLEHRERLVTKEELIENVWKNTWVTDDTLVQCVKEIRRALGDDSHQPRFIKTVPKSGYRFIGSIEKQSNGFHSPEIVKKDHASLVVENKALLKKEASPIIYNSVSHNGRMLLITISILIVAFLLIGFLSQSNRQETQKPVEIALPESTDKKSLAVMYFENRSRNSELEWLSEGVADMLITDLSRSTKLNILSRQQFHALLERNDLHQKDALSLEQSLAIAQKSRATNFITGSFAKAGDKIRLDVQLYDAQNGALIAAESLIVDKPEQILSEIDLLSLKLTAHLGANEQGNPAQLAETMTDDLKAYRFYSLGVEKAQSFHNKEAVELLEKAVALDPQFAMAYARLGYTYSISWGHAAKGKPYLEKAFKLSERLTGKDRLNIQAWYAIANFDYPNAIQSYRQIIAEYPFEIEAYLRLGRLLAGEEQLEEAVEVLRQGLIIDVEAKDIYNALGSAMSRLGRHNEAVAAHQRYVRLAPNEPNAYDSLGLSYQWAGNYAEAIVNYNRALKLKPDFDVAVVHLANTRVELGQYRAAIDLYRRYITVAPSEMERARGYSCIAKIYLKRKDFAAAEKSAAEEMRTRKDAAWDSFVIALETGNSIKAKKLEELIFAPPTISERGTRNKLRFELYQRGYIALRNNRVDEAIQNFQELLCRQPPTWNIENFEDSLAQAYLDLGKFDEAIAEYERILTLNPNYPLARFHLAQAYEGKGLRDSARESYRQFLEDWKNADRDITEIVAAEKFLQTS